jgi:hypothetical protein
MFYKPLRTQRLSGEKKENEKKIIYIDIISLLKRYYKITTIKPDAMALRNKNGSRTIQYQQEFKN